MRIDFHVHGNLSRCSIIKPELAVKVAKKQGLDAIALVNHNKLKLFKSNGLTIINGEEISTTHGHIIGLDIKKEIKKGLAPQKAIDEIKKQGGFVIIPHPFDITRKGLGKKLYELKGYDAIEVNGRCLLNRFNAKAIKFAIEKKVPLIGGSDAHFYPEISSSITIVNAKSVNEALSKIKKRKNKVFIKKKPLLDHRYYFYSSLVNLKKRVTH